METALFQLFLNALMITPLIDGRVEGHADVTVVEGYLCSGFI
jgi:hypothetical protein